MTDTQEVRAAFRDFGGGVNNKLHASQIAKNQSVLLQNINHSTSGKLSTRLGYTQAGNTAVSTLGQVQNLLNFSPEGGTHVLLGITNQSPQKLHFWTGSGDWAEIASPNMTDFTGQEIDSLQFNNKAYFVNGTARAISWDGTTKVQLGTTNFDFPQGMKMLAVWQGRIWAASGTDGQVFFSDALNADDGDWDRANQITKPGVGTGQFVTALRALRNDELIIFMTSSIWRIVMRQGIFGINAFGIQIGGQIPIPVAISETIGDSSQFTPQVIGKDMIFMDQHGKIRSLLRTIAEESQGVEAFPVSDAIQGTIPDDINISNISKSVGIFLDGKYYLSYPDGSDTENSRLTVFDTALQSWSGKDFLSSIVNVGGMRKATISNITGGEKIYFSLNDSDNFNVYRFPDGQADNSQLSGDTTAIEFKLQTRAEDFGVPDREKRGGYVIVDFLSGQNTNATINGIVDGGASVFLGILNPGGETLPQTLPFFAGGGTIVRKRFSLRDLGRFLNLQIEIVHQDGSNEIDVLGIYVVTFAQEPRRAETS